MTNLPGQTRSIHFRIWLGILIAIAMDTMVQLTWKRATLNLPEVSPIRQLWAVVWRPMFHLTVLLWIGQFVNWMLVLARTDLSFAQPLMALSFVTVGIVARLWLHEPLPARRAIGIIIIVMGAGLMAITGPRSALPAIEIKPVAP